MAIQISMMITSMPLPSPPSNLNVHMPSVLSFQYAPVALCMPRRPTWGLPSVPVGFSAAGSELVVIFGSSVEAPVPLDLFICDVGTRCCTMVLLTANLKDGFVAPDGVDSEMTAFRMLFCSETGG